MNTAPWRRYFARIFDFMVAGVALAIPLAVLFPEIFLDESAETLFGILTVLIAFPLLDAFMLANWETSPGKWFLSVRTVRPDGRRLSFREALQRSYGVVVRGMWLAIPFLAIIPLVIAHSRASRGEPQPWEETSGTRTESGSMGLTAVAFGVIMLFLFVLIIAG